ncbi:MAG: sulfatase-like hydrolase/transferase, partial [Urechidicola sp.]|nr:sulfatase-like hydrolase/transferase [Urechidicola sp.]
MKLSLPTLKILIISILFGSYTNAQIESEKQKQPNVLFIIIDDLNDYQGIFGGHPQAKTPNIDRLGASGTIFSNAHTNVPVCSPSRNSLFTGIYPHDSRDFGWTPHFKQAVLKDQKTFIELFKENGYKTYGTGKLLHKNVLKYWDKWGVPEGINYGPHASNGKKIMGHSSVPEPFRSINVVDGSFASFADTPYIIDSLGQKIETGWTYGRKPFRYVSDEDRDLMPDEMHATWIQQKIESLEKSENNGPFFMGVGFVNPHTPLYAPQKYFDMFPLEDIQLPELKEGDTNDIFYSSVYPPTEMGLAYYQKLKLSYPNS